MRLVRSNIDRRLYVVVPHSPARARTLSLPSTGKEKILLRRTFIWSIPGSFQALGAALSALHHLFFRREPCPADGKAPRHRCGRRLDARTPLYHREWLARTGRQSARRAGVPLGVRRGLRRRRSVWRRLVAHRRHTVGYYSAATGSIGSQIGANGNLDTSTATGQVNAFVLTNTGLMAGASLQGTKVTRLASL
jgi:hypothetical protein